MSTVQRLVFSSFDLPGRLSYSGLSFPFMLIIMCTFGPVETASHIWLIVYVPAYGIQGICTLSFVQPEQSLYHKRILY
jgi:hypothetical protein